MKRTSLAALSVLCLALLAASPLLAEQQKLSFSTTVTKSLELDYLLHLPSDYSADGPLLPLVLFLHGAGERGDDIEVVKKHGPPKLVDAGEDIQAIIVSPQCPTGEWWNNKVEALAALLDEIEASYRVDPDRIYVTGLSMGGFGSWALATEQPDRFAAIVPICGGAVLLSAFQLTKLPIWAFHGEADSVVPVEESRRMVEALQRFGSTQAKLTIYPGVNHDSWTQTYENPEVWEWMLSQKRSAQE